MKRKTATSATAERRPRPRLLRAQTMSPGPTAIQTAATQTAATQMAAAQTAATQTAARRAVATFSASVVTLGLAWTLTACGNQDDTSATSSTEHVTPQERFSNAIIERLEPEGSVDEACVHDQNDILLDYVADAFYEDLELNVTDPNEGAVMLLKWARTECMIE